MVQQVFTTFDTRFRMGKTRRRPCAKLSFGRSVFPQSAEPTTPGAEKRLREEIEKNCAKCRGDRSIHLRRSGPKMKTPQRLKKSTGRALHQTSRTLSSSDVSSRKHREFPVSLETEKRSSRITEAALSGIQVFWACAVLIQGQRKVGLVGWKRFSHG